MRRADVTVQAGAVALEGALAIPEHTEGVVLFAHGSGSSRFSPRNRFVADVLNEGALATLLLDLLTAEESEIDERTGELRFDIGLLSRRLIGAVDWLGAHAEIRGLRIGIFGASTGAAAALNAAAERPARVAAVVSRGGRPDLAMAALSRVRAPTLLIVGGLDGPVIGMNRRAAEALECEHRVEIVPGATHLFEEPGKLEKVAQLARTWFRRYLGGAGRDAEAGSATGFRLRS
ncbi:MAG TPA: dienelactone hydrolase family protein [Burkholderiales bacterium]|jgi:pimeloyl-ACP methyl ester carboxylesterase